MLMPAVSPNIFATFAFLSVECRLPLLLQREVRDVVLQHVVLRLDRRELRHKAGVAGRIEDDVPDSEERKTWSGRSQEQSTGDEVLFVFPDVELHGASFSKGG